MHALLTAMQRNPAFGADAFEIGVRRQCGAATEASGGNYVLNQAGKLGSSNIKRKLGPMLARTLSTMRIWGSIGFVVSVLPVFAIAVHLIGSLGEKSSKSRDHVEVSVLRELDVHQVQFQYSRSSCS